MGKGNTTKKGKQKEPTPTVLVSAPPPPPSPPVVPSPPAAHHIQHPSATIDTIEEQGEIGGPLGGPAEGAEEESWQDIGRSADDWMADEPGDNDGDLGDNNWGMDVTQASMPPSAPQLPQKKSGRGRDHAQSYHLQQQSRVPSSNHQNPIGFGANAGAHKSSWGYAQPQQPQDAWAPPDAWGGDDGWADGQADEDDAWETNDPWHDANNDWGQQSHSAAWNHAVSAHPIHTRAVPHAPTSGWQSWGEEARRLPKVTFDPAIPPSPSSSQNKPVLSQLQRSRILNALLNNSQQNQQPYPMPPNAGGPFPPAVANNWHQHQSSQHGNQPQQQQHGRRQSYQHHEPESKKDKRSKPQEPRAHPQQQSKSSRRPHEEVHDVWGLGDGWNDLQDEEEQQDMMQDSWGRRVHFSPGALRASMLPSSVPSAGHSTVVEKFTVNALPQNKLGLSTIPMSKTLSYAYSGTAPSAGSEPGRAAMQRITDIQFIESRGEALKSVEHAFYGKQRKAVDRFHWLFSPEKDERVSSLLNWIHSMSFGVASFGLQKFLQTRERGALIVNAAYRPLHSPSEPAFDWLTWNQIQLTMDRVLQESVGYYNPAMHILVFVFLPSPSGNSVAIWRRKLPIPGNILLAYQAQITQAMASLRKEYPVFVDEYVQKPGYHVLGIDGSARLPAPPEPPPPPKKKRKWYKLWLFS